MKKIMIVVLSLVLLTCVSVLAECRFIDHALALTSLQNGKVKIKKEDLPEAAKSKLGGDAFKGWLVDKVYKLSNGEYEVELKKGDTSQTLKFDKDGKVK